MAKPSNTPIQPVSFTDKAFRSRTILLDDGRSFVVINRAPYVRLVVASELSLV